jgi:flagellar assembly factor FliW
MNITTTRFGSIRLETRDLFTFPAGLIGLPDCRDWALLSDGSNDALAWLQSIERPETALAVVSPRRFVADYQFRAYRSELAPLELADIEEAYVLSIVARNGDELTINLKAPIIVNVRNRVGRQIVVNDDHPLQHVLSSPSSRLKKIA